MVVTGRIPRPGHVRKIVDSWIGYGRNPGRETGALLLISFYVSQSFVCMFLDVVVVLFVLYAVRSVVF